MISSALRSYLACAQMVDPQIHRVDQRRPVLRLQHHHARLDVVRIGRIVHDHRRPVVEPHHKKLVLRIRGAQKLRQRLARAHKLRRHASAQIEDDANRQRRILAGEVLDRLPDVVVENLEIILLQPGHQPVHRIGHRHRHLHQVHVDPQPRFAMRRSLGRDIARRPRSAASVPPATWAEEAAPASPHCSAGSPARSRRSSQPAKPRRTRTPTSAVWPPRAFCAVRPTDLEPASCRIIRPIQVQRLKSHPAKVSHLPGELSA